MRMIDPGSPQCMSYTVLIGSHKLAKAARLIDYTFRLCNSLYSSHQVFEAKQADRRRYRGSARLRLFGTVFTARRTLQQAIRQRHVED